MLSTAKHSNDEVNISSYNPYSALIFGFRQMFTDV